MWVLVVFFMLHVGYAEGIKEGCSQPKNPTYAADCTTARK